MSKCGIKQIVPLTLFSVILCKLNKKQKMKYDARSSLSLKTDLSFWMSTELRVKKNTNNKYS